MRATLLPALALLLVPSFALAAPNTFKDLANLIVILLDNATVVLIVLGIVIYFYGISTNILKFGEEGMEKVRAYFFWGIVVLFLMVSIWGVLRLLQNTLFGGALSPTSNTGASGGSSQSQDLFQAPQFSE